MYMMENILPTKDRIELLSTATYTVNVSFIFLGISYCIVECEYHGITKLLRTLF